ncbi:MAG: hypothetical protein ACOYM2_19815 [Rectinemataceae bacterium]
MCGYTRSEVELKRLERETKRNEIIHLLAMIFIFCSLFLGSLKVPIQELLFVFALNLYLNVYPILVQRYNRLRVLRNFERQRHKADSLLL